MTSCDDCSRPYGDEHGFPDLIIPLCQWRKISPYEDERGLLCPSCICKRLYDAGIKNCPGGFVSGPLRSVTYDTIELMRQVENLELMKVTKDKYVEWSEESEGE